MSTRILSRDISKMASFRPPTAQSTLDTSLLLNSLVNHYQTTGESVAVDFRKLSSYMKLGNQYTHQLHPYPAKLLPSIAGFFLRASVIGSSNGAMLDPFSGSGTVALEASLSGLLPVVADVNPMARLITSVKTTAYDPLTLLQTLTVIARTARRLLKAPEVDVVNSQLWYSKRRKSALERLLRAVRQSTPPELIDFFLICFSVTARRLSNADPAVSVPVRIKEKPSLGDVANKQVRKRIRWLSSVDPITEFEKVTVCNIERVSWANTAFPQRLQSVSAGADARCLINANGEALASDSIPLILSSPPYGSAQKYIRASSLSLNWLGLSAPSGLKQLEGLSIGREHVRVCERSDQQCLPNFFESVVQGIENDSPARAIITRTYLSELASAMTEAYRVLKPMGTMVITVGNNLTAGRLIQNDLFIKLHLESLGARTQLEVTDTIKTRGLMRKRNKTASLIQSETVLMFAKP